MITEINNQGTRWYESKYCLWALLLLGVALRVARYLHNPSLWFDEADISIDVISRPFADLINPSSDYSQTHPLGFLILLKIPTYLLGNSEYALRVFPLFFGVLAVYLFYRVASRFLGPVETLIATAFFAVSDPLIYQASDVKPYAGDVSLTLLILHMAINAHRAPTSLVRSVFFAIVGSMIIWISHPSVFVLAGVGVTLFFYNIKKDKKRAVHFLCVGIMWLVSFAACYFLYTLNLMNSIESNFGVDTLLQMEDSLMPFPPTSLRDIRWYMDNFFGVFNNPGGFTLAGMAALAFLVGCVSLYQQKRETFWILFSPILFTLIAILMRKYAVSARLQFHLVPTILICVAVGVEAIRYRISQKMPFAGVLFVLLIFLHSLAFSAYRVVKPFVWEDLRPVLRHIQNNWQEGDVLYVHYFAQYPFMYYLNYHPEPYAFPDDDYVIGIAPRGWYTKWRKQEVSKYYDSDKLVRQTSIDIFRKYAEDLQQLRGKERVWLLFTMAIPRDGILEEKFFVYQLENMGRQMDFTGNPGVSSAYLYDLSDPEKKPSP